MVRDAARSVRLGEVVSLALNLDQGAPQTGANGRFNCLRSSSATGSDHVAGLQTWSGKPFPRGFGYADDVVTMPLQSASAQRFQPFDTSCESSSARSNGRTGSHRTGSS